MDTEKQIKRIVLNRMERCAVCHQAFGPENIQVVPRRSDMWMMVVTCEECHARNFVAAVLGDGDPDQAQLALRQLSRDDSDADIEIMSEADEAPDGAPVSIDDVIEMHEFLADFDGDFRRYFRSA